MSETFRPTTPEQWSASNGYSGPNAETPSVNHDQSEHGSGDVGKALLVGVLGGVLSAAGYLVYQRLPEEQKERLHSQVRSALQQRINEIRQNFNI